jgi:hypothetical protein
LKDHRVLRLKKKLLVNIAGKPSWGHEADSAKVKNMLIYLHSPSSHPGMLFN